MRALVLLVLLLTPALAAARWYQVDVVIFRHNVAPAVGAEQWPALNAIPDYSDSVDLLSDEWVADGEAASAQIDNAAQPTAFKALRAGERGLLDAESRLRNSSQYTPWLSAAWRQPKLAVSGARRVHLSDVDLRTNTRQEQSSDAEAGEPASLVTPRIEGTVLVKIGRQISVDVDFTYDNEGTPVRLQVTRRAKLREVNYFDHPLFGVLVQILPYDLPDDDPSAGTASDEPLDEGR